jgi:hypothetical protein
MKCAKLLLICLILCPGCRKESPKPEEPNAAVTSPKGDDASGKDSAPAAESRTAAASGEGESSEERVFVSDTNAVTAKLEFTTISEIVYFIGAFLSVTADFVRRAKSRFA